jgi:hypothetical protein
MAMFMDGLRGDTDFLSSCQAVDYSLLMGYDSQRGRVYAGIIDYANTYTLVRRIESNVKSLVESDATIQRPKAYRNRMLRAVKQYFMPVPTRITGMQTSMGMRVPGPTPSLGEYWESLDVGVSHGIDQFGWRVPSVGVRDVAEALDSAETVSRTTN